MRWCPFWATAREDIQQDIASLTSGVAGNVALATAENNYLEMQRPCSCG